MGSSGSGKTVLAKVILEEAALRGIPVIAVDPQGDLASLAIPGRNPTASSRFNVITWTPLSDAGRTLCIGNEVPHSTGVELADARRELAFANDLASLLGYDLRKPAGVIAASVLEAVLGIAGSVRKAAEALNLFDQPLRDPNKRPWSMMGCSYQALNGVRLPLHQKLDPLASPRAIKEIASRLTAMITGARGMLFEHGTPINISAMVLPYTINVIYLNTLTEQAEKSFLVSRLVSALYQWMLTHPSEKPQLLFYLDEIGPFLPAGASRPIGKDALLLLFKQARKYGVSCVMATQNAGDVDYRALAQFGTWYVGRMPMKRDFEKIRGVAEALAPGYYDTFRQELPGCDVGQFFELSGHHGVRGVRARMTYTEHRTLSESEIRRR